MRGLSNRGIERKSKKKFTNELKYARDLYIGEQARLVCKAVDLLRKKIRVDYYFISAGFGFIKEFELLPPYDCTFRNRTNEERIKLYHYLAIEESLCNSLQEKYNVIYLALSKDYLESLGDLSIISSFGEEIILFQDYGKNLHRNFYYIDQNAIIKNNYTQYVFQEKIGGYLRLKGSILLNFAIDIDNNLISIEEFSFIEWWKKKKNEIKKLKENRRSTKCYSDEILD
jgi:hypothetical protein